jgi:hypothetical protein
MRRAELTLEKIKESPKAMPVREFRLSDFVSQEKVEEVHRRNATGSSKVRLFDAVDSYVARIIAYFGYEAYLDWRKGNIPDYRMRRLVEAYRASQLELLTNLEAIVLASGIAGAMSKKAKGPLGEAHKIIKKNEKFIGGEV